MSVRVIGATYENHAARRGGGRPRDDGLRLALVAIVEEIQPCTVRQAFYQASVRGVVPKTEQGYRRVGDLLSELRLRGQLPWHWIADHTRWMRKPTTHADLGAAVGEWAALYRRDLLEAFDSHIEVWLEKDALAGVVYPVTAEWAVPLMVTRGYASLSFLHGAALEIAGHAMRGTPTTIYYFGDHDPSGVDIDRVTERDLRQFLHGFEPPLADALGFQRVAVTAEQISSWNLPTRPTKQSDTRAAAFGGDSVELDAIPPDDLRKLVLSAIEQHVDSGRLESIRAVEQAERESLLAWKARGVVAS